MSRQQSTEGSTLLELLICIAIIMLLVQGSGAVVQIVDRFTVRAELEHIAQLIESARAHAQSSGLVQKITFDSNNGQYLYDGRTYHLPKRVCFGMSKGAQGPPSNPQGNPTGAISFKDNCITVSSQGIVSPGALYLANSQKTMQFCLTCAVAQHTYVRRYEYQNGWQLLE